MRVWERKDSHRTAFQNFGMDLGVGRNLICLIRSDVYAVRELSWGRAAGKPLIKLAKNRYQSYGQTFTPYFRRKIDLTIVNIGDESSVKSKNRKATQMNANTEMFVQQSMDLNGVHEYNSWLDAHENHCIFIRVAWTVP